MKALAAIVVSTVVMAVAATAVMAHPMMYKGTVVSVAATSLQVRAVDDMTKKESTMTFKVSDKTKVYRGDKLVKFADAHVVKDERIVVTTNMDEFPDLALEIRLAAAK